MTVRSAWGWGLVTTTDDGTVLDTWYPAPQLGDAPADDSYSAPVELLALVKSDPRRGVRLTATLVSIDVDDAPADACDAYLRLHLLSLRLVEPNSINLDGLFGKLANVVWTNHGPCSPEGFETTRARLREISPVQVFSVDKFPRMTDYVVPSGVRIGDADRVRLGAHLADGTTVMHEGFVNFNAGTLGHSMIEGRISQGVIVEDGSDIGGSASTMGTLSGGGTQKVRVGKRCLVGAQAGIGIALGDDCVVEAGLYVTAGTKVSLDDGRVVKASELSGQDSLLFIRDSVSGAVRARARDGHGVALNSELHANT